ncbi:GNAT family N-acetyltransferase [Streptacidiphilus anmyonensis]|uniref:GNAT family N-acetyltransferase n=1 Tax=Streptacidiphilus anmyonensis TaxID=405782 RepID=UPI000ABFF833|nr:GNAT family N-acetyltransferase [Streptacidiphilus anmyonensis]
MSASERDQTMPDGHGHGHGHGHGDVVDVAAFLARFARRQAAGTTEFPGGFAVRDPAYARSWEHNQVVVDGATDPELLVDRVDALLDGLGHRMVTVLSDPLGERCAPLLTAAGYRQGAVVVMIHRGARPGAAPTVEELDLDALRPALLRQERAFWPDADEETWHHLVERRTARLRGADEVRFLAARAEDGSPAAWIDLYRDRATGIAQLEDLVTAVPHRGRGHATSVLTTALHRAADARLVFLLADADDWPRQWYARRGFETAGRMHVFTRQS